MRKLIGGSAGLLASYMFMLQPAEAQAPVSVTDWILQLRDPNPLARLSASYPFLDAGRDPQDSIDILLKSLTDPDPNVRRCVASALGELDANPKMTIPALSAALQDPDEMTREHAAIALAKLGTPAVPDLIKLIGSMRVSVDKLHSVGSARQTDLRLSDLAIVSLSLSRAPVIPELFQLCRSTLQEAAVASKAAAAAEAKADAASQAADIAHAKADAAEKALEKATAAAEADWKAADAADALERAAWSAAAAADAAAGKRTPRVMPPRQYRSGMYLGGTQFRTAQAFSAPVHLISSVPPEESLPEYVQSATIFIATKHGKSAIPYLLQQLTDKDPSIRRLALYCMEDIGTGGNRVIKAAADLASKDDDESLRQVAVIVLGRQGPEAVASLSSLLLSSSSATIRAEAAEELGDKGSSASADLAKALSNDAVGTVRSAAAQSLGRLNWQSTTQADSQAALLALAKSLIDKDPKVRSASVYSLTQIPIPNGLSKTIIPLLLMSLRSLDNENYLSIVKVIRTLSPKTETAIPGLLQEPNAYCSLHLRILPPLSLLSSRH